jgi:hypothetical protein
MSWACPRCDRNFRQVSAPYFIKIGPSGKRVSRVALVRTAEDLRTVMPLLREAFDLAVSEKL